MIEQDRRVRDYKDAVVAVAGGSTGIGLAAAVKFAEVGVRRMAVLSKDLQRGRRAVERVQAAAAGIDVVHVSFDAQDPGSVASAIERVQTRFGAIDVLVSSIAPPDVRPAVLQDLSLEEIPAMLTSQSLPPMLLSRAVLPVMQAQNGGCIINIASDGAKSATPGMTVIGAAMASVVMFTRALALEGKRHGIRVNAVTPSLVTGTPTTDRVMGGDLSGKLIEKIGDLAQLGIPSAEDQAELIVFLAGPGAARLTGQAVSVNGGISAF